MLNWRVGWILVAWIVSAAWGGAAQAADSPKLHMQMSSGQISGPVKGDSRIGEGRITYHGNHIGFRVWAGAARSGSQPNHYVLTGKNNSANQLRIRIEKQGWQPNNEGLMGIVLHTGENHAAFDVVIDGDQVVSTDVYMLEMKSAVLFP